MTRPRLAWAMMTALLATGCGEGEDKGHDTEKPDQRPDGIALRAACDEGETAGLEQIELRYEPEDNSLLVSAFMKRRKAGYPDRDFFYYRGKLADGAKLTDPVGQKAELQVACASAECREFSLRLESSRLAQTEKIAAARHDVAEVAVETIDRKTSSTPREATAADGSPIGPYRTDEQAWQYSLERGFDAKASSLITTCHGGRRHVSVFLALNERTILGQSWYAIAGRLGDEKFSVGSQQSVDGRVVTSGLGAKAMTVDEQDGKLVIGTPAGRIAITLEH